MKNMSNMNSEQLKMVDRDRDRDRDVENGRRACARMHVPQNRLDSVQPWLFTSSTVKCSLPQVLYIATESTQELSLE